LPPRGMPITGVPPNMGWMIFGDKFSGRVGGTMSGIVTAAGADTRRGAVVRGLRLHRALRHAARDREQ
jgi:hypothetical protein